MTLPSQKIISSIFTVAGKEYLGPHLIRVLFDMTEKQMKDFEGMAIGANNKIFIPAKGTRREDADKDGIWNVDQIAARRTYTTRKIDLDRKELWIDFVVHEDGGPAAAWAVNARQGDALGIAMKEGRRPLVPPRDHYLLIGDMTAIPVISVILEQMPAHTSAQVILEVYDREDRLDLFSEATVDFKWLLNRELDKKSMLADWVKSNPLRSPGSFVFIAAESEAVKELKACFREDNNWAKENCSIVAYWKRGKSEDESDSERAAERSAG